MNQGKRLAKAGAGARLNEPKWRMSQYHGMLFTVRSSEVHACGLPLLGTESDVGGPVHNPSPIANKENCFAMDLFIPTDRSTSSER